MSDTDSAKSLLEEQKGQTEEERLTETEDEESQRSRDDDKRSMSDTDSTKSLLKELNGQTEEERPTEAEYGDRQGNRFSARPMTMPMYTADVEEHSYVFGGTFPVMQQHEALHDVYMEKLEETKHEPVEMRNTEVIRCVSLVSLIAAPGRFKTEISVLSLILTLKSIGSGIYSIVSDVLAVKENYYYFDVHPEYLILGLTFLVTAGLINSIFSTWWCYTEQMPHLNIPESELPRDAKCPSCSDKNNCKGHSFGHIFQFCASLVFLGQVARQINMFRYGVLHRRASPYCRCKLTNSVKAEYQSKVCTDLGVFEMFLEGIPVFIMQMYIILVQKEIHLTQILSVTSTAFLLPYSVVEYNMQTDSYEDNVDFCTTGFRRTIFQYLWKFFEIIPRILIFAAFTAAYGGWKLGMLISVNSIIMIVWVICFQYRSSEDMKGLDPSPMMAKLRLVVSALALNICFLNTQTGATRDSKLIYYMIVGAQNICMALGWYEQTHGMNIWWSPAITIFVIGSTIPMVVFMVVFYKCAHPKYDKIKNCLPLNEWLQCCNKDNFTHGEQKESEDERSEMDEGSEDEKFEMDEGSEESFT